MLIATYMMIRSGLQFWKSWRPYPHISVYYIPDVLRHFRDKGFRRRQRAGCYRDGTGTAFLPHRTGHTVARIPSLPTLRLCLQEKNYFKYYYCKRTFFCFRKKSLNSREPLWGEYLSLRTILKCIYVIYVFCIYLRLLSFAWSQNDSRSGLICNWYINIAKQNHQFFLILKYVKRILVSAEMVDYYMATLRFS